jgi:uncharacterized protein
VILSVFILLGISTFTLFIHKRWWFWGPILVAAIACAYLSDIMTAWGFLTIGIMWGSYFVLASPIDGWKRGLVAMIAVLFSGLLFFYYMPGFTSQILYATLGLFHFGKPFAGFFILVFLLKLASNRKEFFNAYVKSLPLIIGGLLLLLGAAYLTKYVHYEPHLPSNFWLWAFRNLFFVCIPEEAFFRGFLQNEIRNAMPQKMGAVTSIVLSSLCFVVIHLQISLSGTFLCMIFVAGIIFGLVYYLTDSIESAILIHFFTNLLHKAVFVS